MIEVPRAALTAGEIAESADFFSFDTNDLTQMTFGFCRDDIERGFLLEYLEKGILSENPFRILDRNGVGRLIAMAVSEGRQSHEGLATGVIGEHANIPSRSISFIGLVSTMSAVRPIVCR